LTLERITPVKPPQKLNHSACGKLNKRKIFAVAFGMGEELSRTRGLITESMTFDGTQVCKRSSEEGRKLARRDNWEPRGGGTF
jgi:hypothetical protein